MPEAVKQTADAGRARRGLGFRVSGAAMILALAACGAIGWLAWRRWEVLRDRDIMAHAQEAMERGHYAVAARDLAALGSSGIDPDRATYLLGACEKALGRTEDASAAWARIRPDSPLGGRAIADRLDLLTDQGRLAEAEQLIEGAARDRGAEGTALRMLIAPVIVQEGRQREALRLIELRWRALDERGEGASEQALNLARLHVELRSNVPPLDLVRSYLERAGTLAPRDDRVWLGRANLAIRLGLLDEARRWLCDCVERRPEDPAVWRGWLEWAIQARQFDKAREAVRHLPAEVVTLPEVCRLSAWFARSCGDVERERRELASLIELAPDDTEALGRLEAIESQSASASSRSGRRARREELDRDRSRYAELYRRNQPSRDAEELARLAGRLGQTFEEVAYLTAAVADEPRRADLAERLRRLRDLKRRRRMTGTLADWVSTDCGGSRGSTVGGLSPPSAAP